jgi:Asp-tRNA(Asn)/Glu-tRNA(Gln) amidotransferase A subunit family amidase
MGQEQFLHELTAAQVREHLVEGRSSVAEFIDRQLAFAGATDESIQAFAHFDPEVIRLQAVHLDAARSRGEDAGELFGIPVGVKDIIDTFDMPTAHGCPVLADRYPIADATVVQRLRQAGAVVFGKTATTEFATFTPAATRNPHRLTHTPGGSSSGSAAAVASGMVPVAIGSQTNGSVIRPASFCGVYGFKPSFGLIPRTGVLEQSPSLDHLGVFARTIDDLARVAEVLVGDDGHDPACQGVAPRRLLRACLSEPLVEPKFCFVRSPWWERMSTDAREACEAFVEHLSDRITVLELPPVVEAAVGWHATVNDAELALCVRRELRDRIDAASPALRDRVARGAALPVIDYLAAKDRIAHVCSAFDEYFERYDAILCPAALGSAPEGLASTGDPIMATVWTFGGLPALNLPLLTLSDGLPFGIQAVGSFRNDGRLLRSCRWLVDQFLARNA